MKAIRIVLILILSLSIIGCNNSSNNSGSKTEIKIGAVIPLTGPGAMFGEYIKKGLEFAAEELNQGNDEYEVKIILEDSKTSPKDGIAAFNKLASLDNVSATVVAMSSIAKAISNLADKTGVVQIGIAVATPDYTKASDYIFRVYPNATSMAGIMAEYNSKELGAKSSAVVYVDDEFGRTSYKVYDEVASGFGNSVVFSESYQNVQKDFKNLVAKLLNAGSGETPDCIYLNGYGLAYSSFIKQLYEDPAAQEVTLTADMTLGLPATLNQVGGLLKESYYVDGIMSSTFIDGYTSHYQEAPTSYAGYAYDIVNLVYKAAMLEPSVKINGDVIKAGLFKTEGYSGAMGRISFDDTGDSNLEFEVNTIIDGKKK